MSEDHKASRPDPGNDNHTLSVTGLGADFIMALRFYARLWSGDSAHEVPNLSRIAMALPFASLVMGLVPALFLLGANGLHIPSFLSAVIAVALSIGITGAMSEDAIGDAADGLAGGQTPERRLEIFKDSRLGTYGVCAILFFCLFRVSALSALIDINPLAAACMWIAAGILSRSASLWLTLKLPPARKDGASASVGRVNKRAFGIGFGFAILISFLFAAPSVGIFGFVLAIILAGLMAWGWAWLCEKLIGAQTGDLIGALQALLEIAVLSAFIVIAAH